MNTTMKQQSQWIGTSNKGYSIYADNEIRKLFSDIQVQQIIPAEVFLFQINEKSKQDVLKLIKTEEPMFLRHIHPVDKVLEIDRTKNDFEQINAVISEYTSIRSNSKVTIQIRKIPETTYDYALSEIRDLLTATIEDRFQSSVVVREADWIISLFFTEHEMYIGLSSPNDNLSDWSGGAIRFQKEEGQVSRAKFKLLEAEYRFQLDFSKNTNALDIGAAPGGWTSLLLERGVHVTAVDPAKLDASLFSHPHLKYLQKNASELVFKNNTFDLLVCDMSWSPRQMTRLIKELLYALESGGTAIITAKLMHKKPFKTVKEIAAGLASELTLIKAKQLFHNREELTMYFEKK